MSSKATVAHSTGSASIMTNDARVGFVTNALQLYHLPVESRRGFLHVGPIPKDDTPAYIIYQVEGMY